MGFYIISLHPSVGHNSCLFKDENYWSSVAGTTTLTTDYFSVGLSVCPYYKDKHYLRQTVDTTQSVDRNFRLFTDKNCCNYYPSTDKNYFRSSVLTKIPTITCSVDRNFCLFTDENCCSFHLFKDENYFRSSVVTTIHTITCSVDHNLCLFTDKNCCSFYLFKDENYFRSSVVTTIHTITCSVDQNFCLFTDENSCSFYLLIEEKYGRFSVATTTNTVIFFSVYLRFSSFKDRIYDRQTENTNSYKFNNQFGKKLLLVFNENDCTNAFSRERMFSKLKLWIRSTAIKCGSCCPCSTLPDNVTDWHFGPIRSKPRRPHGYAYVPINVRRND